MKRKVLRMLLMMGIVFYSMSINAYATSDTDQEAQAEISGILIDGKNFPDAAFRSVVETYDVNADGYLSEEEIQNVTKLVLEDKTLENLKGIEHFVNLNSLWCQQSGLTGELGSLPEGLKELVIDNSQLKKVSKLPENLRILYLRNNQLEELPELPEGLKELMISENNLESLPVLPNNLQLLNAAINKLSELPELPSGLEKLIVSVNQLKALPELPEGLKYLGCASNELTIIPELPEGLESLYCEENQLKELPEFPASLKNFQCYENQLSILPSLKNTKVIQVDCKDNQLTSITDFPEGFRNLNCTNNKLKTLPDLPDSLYHLSCSQNELEKLPVLPMELQYLECWNNQLTELPELPNKLQVLGVAYNKISGTLDVGTLEKLYRIDVQGNRITKVILCPEAEYEAINLFANYLESTSDISGRDDIQWDGTESKFQFEPQKSKGQQICEIKGQHTYSKYYPAEYAGINKVGYKSGYCDVCQLLITIEVPGIKTIALSDTLYTYDGKVKTPSVIIKDFEGKTLKKNVDFSVTYSKGRKNTGRYKVTVTLKGDYRGSKTLYFSIMPKAPKSVKATLYGHDDVKVTWSKCTGAKGYKVYYKKINASKYVYLKTTTGTSYKKANLSDGTKYTFKVVPYYKNGSTNAESKNYKTVSFYTLKKVNTPVITKVSSKKIKVQYDKVNGASGYQISKSTRKGKTGSLVRTTSLSKSLTVKKKKTYYYKVRAYKTVGSKRIYGPWSNVKAYKLK